MPREYAYLYIHFGIVRLLGGESDDADRAPLHKSIRSSLHWRPRWKHVDWLDHCHIHLATPVAFLRTKANESIRLISPLPFVKYIYPMEGTVIRYHMVSSNQVGLPTIVDHKGSSSNQPFGPARESDGENTLFNCVKVH